MKVSRKDPLKMTCNNQAHRFKPLIFILGPTAVGKTEWALKLAENAEGIIVNGDSVQLYRELNIGSAKPIFKGPAPAPHYLFGCVKAPQVWTAGDYRRAAMEILHKNLKERPGFVPGGSGFYLQALEKGMYPSPSVTKKVTDELKAVYEKKGLDFLYGELKKQDPRRAEETAPGDSYRILRALAVIKSGGRRVSEIKKDFSAEKPPWPCVKIGLRAGREDLIKRVESRTRDMLKKGLIEETEGLLKKGLESWRPLQSVGYRETRLFLKGRINRGELYSQIVQNTLRLAKKQKKWFARDKDIIWYDFKTDPLSVYRELKTGGLT